MSESHEPQQSEAVFHEVQHFSRVWFVIPVVVAAIAVGTLGAGLAWYSDSLQVPTFVAGHLLVVGSMVAMAFLLAVAALVTEVRDDGLHVRFRGLFVRRTISFADVTACEPRKYSPIWEYGGWGVRWTPWRGRAYNARGHRGVQLTLSRGKRLLIGSQRPDDLAQAIRDRMPPGDAA